MKNVKEMTDAELDKLRRSTIWWTDKGQRAAQEELKRRTDAVACEKTVAVDPISADAHYIAQCARDDAREASGRIVKHLWIIFVLLPIVLGILFMLVK